jgi:hypothetical protein
MASRCFALWVNRNGQHLWAGPFPHNVAAQHHLDMVPDKTGGSLVTMLLPAYRPSELLEADPILGMEGTGDHV